MEEARYWIWAKQKKSLSSHILAKSTNLSSTYGDSWEEQAFGQDASGLLGGCIWPPRLYTCSFCKREFKSAQALGGHMNVHRRDRARLKQLSPDNHLSNHPATTSSGIHYSSQNHNFVFDQKPIGYEFPTSPPSTLNVSLPISKVIDWHENSALSLSPPFSSKIFEDEQMNILGLSPSLNSNVVTVDKYCYAISDEEKKEKNFNFLEPKYGTKKIDYDATDLSVNLNDYELITTSSNEDGNMKYKRRRTMFDDDDDDATKPFFPKQSLIDGKGVVHDPQVEVVKVSPHLKEDLDLELRLGDHRSAKG